MDPVHTHGRAVVRARGLRIRGARGGAATTSAARPASGRRERVTRVERGHLIAPACGTTRASRYPSRRFGPVDTTAWAGEVTPARMETGNLARGYDRSVTRSRHAPEEFAVRAPAEDQARDSRAESAAASRDDLDRRCTIRVGPFPAGTWRDCPMPCTGTDLGGRLGAIQLPAARAARVLARARSGHRHQQRCGSWRSLGRCPIRSGTSSTLGRSRSSWAATAPSCSGLLALARRGRPGLLFLDGHADFAHPEDEPSGEVSVDGPRPRNRARTRGVRSDRDLGSADRRRAESRFSGTGFTATVRIRT